MLISAAYIKVYLLENGICVAKKKTKSVRKSLDPLYNQVLVFSESPQGKVVQVRYNVAWFRIYSKVDICRHVADMQTFNCLFMTLNRMVEEV